MKWCRLLYLVPLSILIASVLSSPGQFESLFITGIIVLLVLLLCDAVIMTVIDSNERTERELIRKRVLQAAQEKRNKTKKEKQVQVAMEWLDRCSALGGFPGIQSSYPCKRGEGVLFSENFVRLQETRKVRAPGGISVDQWTTLESGTLHVTNQRLIFIGESNTRSIAIKDLVDETIYLDAIDVTSCKRSKTMRFLCDNPALIRAIVDLAQRVPNMQVVSEEQQQAEETETNTPKSVSDLQEPVRKPHASILSQLENIEMEEEERETVLQALKIIVETQRASTSSLQRRLRIGYLQASHIMDILEQAGLVGPAKGAEPRAILFDVSSRDWDKLKSECFHPSPDAVPVISKRKHTPQFLHLVEDYLERLADVSSGLGSFIRELDGNPAVEEILGRVEGIDAVEGLGIFSTKNAKLGFLVFEDLMKTWKGLGYSLESAQIPDLGGLAAGVSQVVSPGFGMARDEWLEEEYRNRVRATMMGLEQKVRETVELVLPDDQFLFPFVFSFSQDWAELGQRFLTLLYRWASIVAKADQFITDAESAWLAKIISAAGISGEVVPRQGRVIADPTLSEPMRNLEKMVGLGPVKAEVEKLASLVRIQQERERQGIKTIGVSYHCVFTGNPGTGKTTVARIVAGIYKDLGVLKKGHLVETDRTGLVAEYVGQTGPKTNKVIDSALDGVLFIDEAYALVEGGRNDYGKEAIATLLKRMEDDRARLVVILAGYSENMKRFIESNPGLQSRFNRYIEFPDYEAGDLVSIFKRFAQNSQYQFGKGAEDAVRQIMERAVAHKDRHFGNGRFARNVFEKAIERQALRLASIGQLTKEMLQELLPEDIPEE